MTVVRTEAITEESRPNAGEEVVRPPGKRFYGGLARRGAIWSIIRQGGGELVALPTSMIMARLLSPDDFGIAAAASFFIVLATRLTQLGFNAALVRVEHLRPDHLSTVFVVNAILGALTYMVLFALSPAIGSFLRNAAAGELVRVAALIFIITPFGTVPAALMTRNMQFRHATVTDWTDAIVGALLSVVLAALGYGYWSLIIGQLTGTAVRIVQRLYLTNWYPSLRFSRAALRELLSFGLGLQTKRLLEYAAFNLDNVVVGRVLGMTALGFYDKAFTTMNRMVNRLTLGDTFFRIFSIIHEDPERFRRAYSKLLVTVSMIALPAFAGAIILARPLFAVLYGEQWLAAVLPFQVLCVGGMLKLLNAYASQANEAVGNIWPQARRQAAGVVLIIAGAWAGSHYAGITGAALGVVVAMAALTASMQALVRRSVGLRWSEMLGPLGPAAVGTALVVAVLLAVDAGLRTIMQPAAWQVLGAQALSGAAAYAAFVLFSPFAAVRQIVAETLQDWRPGGVRLPVCRNAP